MIEVDDNIKIPVMLANSSLYDDTKFKTPVNDVDKLVKIMKERLCLNSRQNEHAIVDNTLVDTGCVSKSAPKYGKNIKLRKSAFCARECKLKKKCNRCKKLNLSNTDSRLLQQLITEQRLIQEAVRRLQYLHYNYDKDTGNSTNESQVVDEVKDVMC